MCRIVCQCIMSANCYVCFCFSACSPKSDEPDAQNKAGEGKLASSRESIDTNTGTYCLILELVSRKDTGMPSYQCLKLLSVSRKDTGKPSYQCLVLNPVSRKVQQPLLLFGLLKRRDLCRKSQLSRSVSIQRVCLWMGSKIRGVNHCRAGLY